MNNILLRLIISQFKIFFREPGVVFWSFGFPIIMAWILGIAFTKKGEILHNVAIVIKTTKTPPVLPQWLYKKTGNINDELSEETELEWEIGQENGEYERFRFHAMTKEEAVLALKRGKIGLWIEGDSESVISYRFDPANAEARLTYLLLEGAFSPQKTSDLKAEMRPLTMVGIRYVDFLIPGLMAMMIMNACLWGIGWNLIELRIKKLLRRMVATPLKKSIFLISHGLNRMILSAAEMLLLYIFAYFYFDITIQGTLPALALVFFSGYCAFAGIAILISSRVQNTQSGNGMINVVTMPMFVLSGVFFSYHNFPDWLIHYVEVLPLTMLTNSLRGIITEGIGLTQVIQPSIVLFGIGTACFLLGLKLFRWH